MRAPRQMVSGKPTGAAGSQRHKWNIVTLQRIELVSAVERDALVGKTTELLSLQFCPRETEDYCKLIKRFGLAAAQNVIGNARVKNEKSKRLLDYMGRTF